LNLKQNQLKTPEYKSKVVERLRKKIPLETKIRVALEMNDYDNWENGTYKGSKTRLTKIIMDIFKNHKLNE
jgi:hypothetical protein